MALQLGALRAALIDSGASPEKAAAAAEEVAKHFRGRSELELPLFAIVVICMGCVGAVLSGIHAILHW
ncbi:hypothetical protein [Lichenicoccus sp.]|uniref:hypothetical protein n=1 Tax=Lichenicoccus sp. TaxID=2781899 RepID=UPI003D143624